ncbi:helix-turn-helix domain-containing protein [Micromonospora taraxaci]|uniref:helix-turn-helix domain-containing protein n=1 Tax=Micromonospora taraxaci TaxID=1316803 RepID=UPI003C2ADF73
MEAPLTNLCNDMPLWYDIAMPRGRPVAFELPPGPARDLMLLLRRLARTRGFSNSAIAAKIAMSASYVGEVLNGRKCPAPATAATLVAALGGTPADTTTARRLAEKARELQRYQRKRQPDGPEPPPVEDLWEICVAFVLALDKAHKGLRDCAGEPGAGDPDLAVHDSGLYAHRERLLLAGPPGLVTAGEAVFHALIEIRAAVRRGATLETDAYREVYSPFADAMWNFRAAVRTAIGQKPMPPEVFPVR